MNHRDDDEHEAMEEAVQALHEIALSVDKKKEFRSASTLFFLSLQLIFPQCY